MSRAAWRWGLGSFVGLRLVATLVAAYANTRLEVGETVSVPGYQPPELTGFAEHLLGVWLRADALWYLKVAGGGYGDGPAEFAFFPLLPLLVRWLMPVFGGNELYSALFVTNVACALGLVALFALVDRVGGEGWARAATVGLALYPTSFFLVAPYAESLLLATGASAVFLALKGRPALAAGAGALAALARPFGVLLALPLAAAAWRGKTGRSEVKAGWLAALGPVAAAAGWFAWVAGRTGDALGALRVQSLWQRDASFPLRTLWQGIRSAADRAGSDLGPYFALDAAASLFGCVVVVAATVMLRRRGINPWLRWALLAYGLAVIGIPLAYSFSPRPLMSIPRFTLALFPFFLAYGGLNRSWRWILGVLSGAGLVWATAVFVAARPLF